MPLRILGLGHGLFAIAAASLAVLSIAYRDFAPMWQSIPGFPGREICVYGSAIVLLAASAGLCLSRTALPSVLTIGAYQAAWTAAGTSPIISKPLNFGSWYGFCEASTSLLGASILYAILRWQWRASAMPIAGQRVARAARVMFGLDCVFYGWSHFVYADYTASMVPAWLPDGLGFAYFTGLGHIAAGIGIIAGILPRLAANLEATMMSLFGLLVWIPSLFAQPRPRWAGTPHDQWSELVVTLVLAASAWVVADSLRKRPWSFASRSRE